MYKLVFEKNTLFRFFEKLVEAKGFKLRIGDYRVVADIIREKDAIIILKVGHRKNIYDR
jgi:mRNA interferase RelE/StbE